MLKTVIYSAILYFAFTSLTIYVEPPLGNLTLGKTVLMWKLEDSPFIDSTETKCLREYNQVNEVCRGLNMLQVKLQGHTVATFPYSAFLDSASIKIYVIGLKLQEFTLQLKLQMRSWYQSTLHAINGQ